MQEYWSGASLVAQMVESTGVGCDALPQVIFPTQGGTQVSLIAGRFFTL